MRHVPLLVTAFSLLLSVTLPAAPAAAQVLQGDEALYTQSTGFLANHPDLKFRKRGLQAYFRGVLVEGSVYLLDWAANGE